MLRLVLEAMRPEQWLKNAFVLGGLLYSGQFTDPQAVGTSLLVAFAFCLASGAAYLVNDVADREVDRYNPRTAGRPIARASLRRESPSSPRCSPPRWRPRRC